MMKKETNPKDALSVERLPLASTLPTMALPEVALAMAHGARKYGPHNWTKAGARASVYVDACMRHLWRWWAFREHVDADSGAHHLAHAIASLMILMDAEARGLLVDDRPFGGNRMNWERCEREWKRRVSNEDT